MIRWACRKPAHVFCDDTMRSHAKTARSASTFPGAGCSTFTIQLVFQGELAGRDKTEEHIAEMWTLDSLSNQSQGSLSEVKQCGGVRMRRSLDSQNTLAPLLKVERGPIHCTLLWNHARLSWRSDRQSRAGNTRYITIQRVQSGSKRGRGGWARLRGGSGAVALSGCLAKRMQFRF
eukprot:6180624-Pleurochrysis_carterae.AAC.4